MKASKLVLISVDIGDSEKCLKRDFTGGCLQSAMKHTLVHLENSTPFLVIAGRFLEKATTWKCSTLPSAFHTF